MFGSFSSSYISPYSLDDRRYIIHLNEIMPMWTISRSHVEKGKPSSRHNSEALPRLQHSQICAVGK
jgi:hypothetical protein